MQYNLLHDSGFSHLCNKEFWEKWKELTSKKNTYLHLSLKILPKIWVKTIPFEKIMKQSYPINALHLWDATEKLLWHQQLVHPCDKYLYNSHKYIYGVQKFSDTTSKVLDQ